MTTWKIFYWLTCAAIIVVCIVHFEDIKEKAATSLSVFAFFSLIFTILISCPEEKEE